ncbi:hypothetical protein O6H91_03G044200 [Diphasiastrum complanatum]|uniref:Uncharacterized protein n=1 Tax=Diphasiastrum complanatum TaxID=34168 RepID=A0ACC2E5L1_DIPCM|nr:hypothetical protein O6H91_03G044200 [Diphasiastrum complanatum]
MDSSSDWTSNGSNSMFLHAENGFLECEKSNDSDTKSNNGFEPLENAADVVCITCGAKACNHQNGVAASDVHMASRRAEEAAIRRFQAITWLQNVVGSLGISNEPSEEELRLCLRNGLVLCNLMNRIHPGAIPKIVESPASLSASDGALSAYQHFENVRNFLVAVEELKLPSFEASDLDQGSLLTGSMVKVVDCILALKSYYDWRENGSMGMWKYSGAAKNNTKPSAQGVLGSVSNGTVPLQKTWTLFDMDSEIPLSPDSRNKKQNNGRNLMDNMLMKNGEHDQHVVSGVTVGSNNLASSTALSDSTASWINHIRQKFHEVLMMRPQFREDVRRSESFTTSDSLDPLSHLVRAVLVDKKPEEVPMLVEFMLRKVIEEFERRLSVQATQVKKLRITLKELLSQEDRLLLRLKTLETLAAGSGEEVKLVADQLQLIKIEKKQIEEQKKVQEENTEKLKKAIEERQVQVEVLRSELEEIRSESKEHVVQLELQKILEYNAQATIKELSSQLDESKLKVQNLEAVMKSKLQNFREQQIKSKNLLTLQLPLFEELKSVLYTTKQDASRMKLGWQKEIVSLQSQLEGVVAAATSYHKVLAENRKLYNEVQDLKGNIRVFCRVRPFLGGQAGKHSLVDFIGENGDISICNTSKQGRDSSKLFKFNKVYGASSSQEEVFHDTRPLIRSVLDGFNVCIFAYGQTGSGKTYTMSGPCTLSEETWGVNYRALNDLFQISQSRRDVIRYEVGVQMIEIYNEQVRDLLSLDGAQKRLEIRNNSQQNGLNVPDACMLPVKSTDDVVELMNIGQRNRAIGATALNERSSRSHSVLTVHVQGTDLATGSILRGCLHLVDLAGSERVDKSEAVGERLREAQHINKSLSALGDVISALAQKSSHIPYRNSKLTQLLQESLGGQAKTLMFVHISPDNDSYGETMSTLKFAERVASVELGAARTNKESGEVRELKEQVALLQDALSRKEVDITKKDSEIERLHNLKGVRSTANERCLGAEKPRVKSVKSLSDIHRSSAELQMPNSRKYASDIMGNVEGRQVAHISATRAQKRPIMGPSTQDLLPNGFEGVSTLRSSACVGTEDGTDKVGLPKLLHSRSASTDSQSSGIGTLVPSELMKQKARDAIFDRSTSLKDWTDRIQMSNDSLFASGSLDEEFRYWDDNDVLKLDEESYTPHFGALPPDFMVTGSDMEINLPIPPITPNDISSQRILTEPAEENLRSRTAEARRPGSTDILNGFMLGNDSLSNHHFDVESIDARVDFDDRLSEFSEGGLSQETETDSLIGSSSDLALSRKSHTRKLQSTDKRSLLQTQIPRPPSRHDRKQSEGGQSHASNVKRHVPAVPTFSSTDNGLKKQYSSPETKFRQTH